MPRLPLLLLLPLVVACSRPLRPLVNAPTAMLSRCANGLMLAPVELGDEEWSFIVDTGASITAVTPHTASQIDLEVSGRRPIYGETNTVAKLAQVPSLAIAGEVHRDLRVAVLEVPAAGRISARHDGVLGLDVLSRHDTVLDLSRGLISLLPPGGAAREHVIQEQFVRVPITLIRDGLIRVDVMVGGEVIPAVLDFGATATMLNPQARSLRGERGLRIGDVDLGPRSLEARQHRIYARWGLEDRPAMLLAADVLLGRTLVIAYRERALYLSRTKASPQAISCR